MIYLLRLSLLFILFSTSVYVSAQDSSFYFSYIGVENGLSQTSVLKIYQHSDGFIWFGTRNGLNRYDGYEFKIYRNEVNNQNSLSDNYITDIAEDQQKNLWIGTTNGLNHINYQTGKVTRSYPQSFNRDEPKIISILTCKDGRVFAFTRRTVFRCDTDKGVMVDAMPMKQIDSNIEAVVEDGAGNICIATLSSGLYVFDAEWNEISRFVNIPGDDTSIVSGNITTLFVDQEQVLWIGTSQNGLCRKDPGKNTFTRLNSDNTSLSNNFVRVIQNMGKDSLLIGTFAGLNILNKKDLTIYPVKMDPDRKGALSHYSVHSLLFDTNNTLWVGTYSGGVNYHSPYYKRISFFAPDGFTGIMGGGKEDASGNIWFASEGRGLLYYNPRTGQQVFYPVKLPYEQHFETNIIKSIWIEGDSIYCGTHFGSVYLFSIKSRKFTLLHDFKYNDIYSLYIDSKQRLWIPTHNTNHLVMVEDGHYTNKFMIDGMPQSFESVSTVKEIRPDVFLLGTLGKGLVVYNRNENTSVRITETELGLAKYDKIGAVTALVSDSLGNLWVATTKSGVFRFDNQMNLKKHYVKESGMADSYISSIILDKEQNLWVTTGSELYRLDRDSDLFSRIKFENVPSQEFTLYAGTVSSQGVIYLSGSKGVLSFNPAEQYNDPVLPPVYVTSLLIDNKIDTTGNKLVSSTLQLPSDKEIILQANQTNITIQYTALNYINPNQNQYAYKLEGVDANWVYVNNRREAFYSNLNPGSYTFSVKASNGNDVWNPEEATLRIVVKPPLWKTWWAYLIYIGILSVVIWRFVSVRWMRLKLENDIRFKQMEKERVEEMHSERMRLFTNFSHELRTPLTLIINPVDDLLRQMSFSTEVKASLQMIKKNTGRLLLLVNNLMDIQKYEADKMILQKSRFDFMAFLQEMHQSFESVAQNRNISLTLHADLPEHYFVNYDREEIEKVFFNLLSNALKFTPEGGTVSIHVSKKNEQACLALPLLPGDQQKTLVENHYLYIEVADTGKGIDSKVANKIFEPFYRSDEDLHKQIAGTGIGLNLTRSIVLHHNGCIWTESSVATGTRMMLLLPDTEKQQSALAPETTLSVGALQTSRKVALLMEEADSKNKPTVLIADDNPEVLDYLEEQLCAQYIVWKAVNGREALQQIEKSFPDILISDVMMPEMNGIELCRRIKENINFCHIPVILLTAKSMISQIEEGWEVGADDYVVKPFHVSLLCARIRNILASRQQMKAVYGDKLSLKSLGVETGSADDTFLNQYMDIVKANITNSDFDVSVIYQTIGMSRANFYRKVKTVTGLSPIELIKNIRMEASARLLETTTMTVSEISRQVGFSSSSYFARNFKEVYGISPTEYQEKNMVSGN